MDGSCEYCRKRPSTTLDHFVPLVVKGKPTTGCNDLWNSVPACKECNCSKGNRAATDWLRSDCVGNPLRSVRSAPERQSVLARFEAYERIVQASAAKKMIDPAWWQRIEQRVSCFLARLQMDIDIYAKKRMVVVVPVPVVARARPPPLQGPHEAKDKASAESKARGEAEAKKNTKPQLRAAPSGGPPPRPSVHAMVTRARGKA